MINYLIWSSSLTSLPKQTPWLEQSVITKKHFYSSPSIATNTGQRDWKRRHHQIPSNWLSYLPSASAIIDNQPSTQYGHSLDVLWREEGRIYFAFVGGFLRTTSPPQPRPLTCSKARDLSYSLIPRMLVPLYFVSETLFGMDIFHALLLSLSLK